MHKVFSYCYPSSTNVDYQSQEINILFVHGSCAGSIQYETLVSSLVNHFMESLNPSIDNLEKNKVSQKTILNCHMFDAVGCGESRQGFYEWRDFSEKALAEDLEFIMNLISQSSENKGKNCRKFFIVAHSYGTSQVIKLVNKLELLKDSTCIEGIVLIGSALHGGPHLLNRTNYLFRLPVFVLNWMQNMLTNAFVDAAYYPETETSLKDNARAFCNKNDMAMAKAFYRQTKWADEIGRAHV